MQFMWSQTSTSTVCPKPDAVNATDVALGLVNATVLEPCTAGSATIDIHDSNRPFTNALIIPMTMVLILMLC